MQAIGQRYFHVYLSGKNDEIRNALQPLLDGKPDLLAGVGGPVPGQPPANDPIEAAAAAAAPPSVNPVDTGAPVVPEAVQRPQVHRVHIILRDPSKRGVWWSDEKYKNNLRPLQGAKVGIYCVWNIKQYNISQILIPKVLLYNITGYYIIISTINSVY